MYQSEGAPASVTENQELDDDEQADLETIRRLENENENLKNENEKLRKDKEKLRKEQDTCTCKVATGLLIF